MQPSTLRATLALGTLLLGTLASVIPTATAQDASDWSAAAIIDSGTIFAPSNVRAAYNSYEAGEYGVAYSKSSNIGFSLLNGSTWTSKTNDATGANNRAVMDLIATGPDTWGMLVHDTGASTVSYWSSTDDGATWTVGGALSGTSITFKGQLLSPGLGSVQVAWINVATNAAYYAQSTDHGATWTTPDVISDNRGAPGVAGSAALTVHNVALSHVGTTTTAWFLSTTANAVYKAESVGGVVWSVPYTTVGGTTPVDGGTTTLPISSTSCTGTMGTTMGADERANFAFMRTATVSGKTYLCRNAAEAVSSLAPPNNEQAGERIPMFANAGGSLIAYSDATTADSYIYYRGPGSSAAALSKSVLDTSSGDVMDLAGNDTQAYFIYANTAVAGRLEAIHATIFSNLGEPFCPDPLETPDYGYAYRRGADFFDQDDGDISGVGLSTGFNYNSTTSESSWDYSAKSFSPGSRAFHENFTIEAGTDASSSRFRVSFNSISGATPSVTSKGDGLTTGNFADHAEVQLLEDDNDWQVSFYYVTGGGTRTLIGSVINGFGNPNDATPFTVWYDARSTATGPPSSWFGGTGGSTSSGPYIALTFPGELGPLDEENTIIGIRSLPAAFLDDPVYDVWNIGSGGTLTANTAIDENIQTGSNTDDEGGYDSTCIFDDAGESLVVGSAGATPESLVPSGGSSSSTSGGCSTIVCTDSTNVPEGFTLGTFNAMLGVFLVAGISAGGYFALGRSPFVAGGFAIVGLILANILGLIPLWVIIVLVILGTAVIFLAVKKSAG